MNQHTENKRLEKIIANLEKGLDYMTANKDHFYVFSNWPQSPTSKEEKTQ